MCHFILTAIKEERGECKSMGAQRARGRPHTTPAPLGTGISWISCPERNPTKDLMDQLLHPACWWDELSPAAIPTVSIGLGTLGRHQCHEPALQQG